MEIVSRIVQLCNKENISIAELERKMNFGNGTIRKWDKSYPSIDKVMKIANYFDVKIDYICFGRKETKNNLVIEKFENLSKIEKKAIEHLIDFYINEKVL